MTRRLAAAFVGCAVLLASACSSSSSPGGSGSSGAANGPSTATGTTASVSVKNFAFSPARLVVNKGTAVTWTFQDSTQHNVTASGNAFKSTDQSSGGSYSFTFNTAGSYDYICSIHPYMKGNVTVR